MSIRLEMMQRAHKAEREAAEWKAKSIDLSIKLADAERQLNLCKETLIRIQAIVERYK